MIGNLKRDLKQKLVETRTELENAIQTYREETNKDRKDIIKIKKEELKEEIKKIKNQLKSINETNQPRYLYPSKKTLKK